MNVISRHYSSRENRLLKSEIVRDINFIYPFIKNLQWKMQIVNKLQRDAN